MWYLALMEINLPEYTNYVHIPGMLNSGIDKYKGVEPWMWYFGPPNKQKNVCLLEYGNPAYNKTEHLNSLFQ